MGGTGDSRRGRPPIDNAAKAAFLAALRDGSPRQVAAVAGGYSLNSFYRARRRDPLFRMAWDHAHAASAAAERAAAPDRRRGEADRDGEAAGPVVESIVPNNRRRLQRRWLRNVRFDEARRMLFLDHFAWTCDARAAAAKSGVCERTVLNHRRRDPAFAAAFEEALEQGYVILEAEALRQRLAAQQRLRAALEAGQSLPMPAELADEFERVLKLLSRRDRRKRAPAAVVREAWTFDAAIELLARRLEALDIPVQPLAPAAARRFGGAGETP